MFTGSTVGVSDLTQRPKPRPRRGRRRTGLRDVRDSPSGVALIGVNGRFLRANPALGQMLGRSTAELEQLIWRDVFAGALQVADADLPVQRPDGAERSLRCRARKLDEATTLVHVENVTAERETALLAAVVASVIDAVITTDAEAHIVFLNEAAERMFGVTRATVAGRSAVDTFVHPDDRAAAHAWVRRLASGEPMSSRQITRLQRADGTLFDAELGVFAVRDGDALLGMGGIVRDVSDRLVQDAEAGVVRAVVDSAAEGIIGIDADGDVRYFSPSAERIYGYQADEMIGRPASMLAADDREAHARTLHEELRSGRTVYRDTVAQRKDGTHIDVHVTASPIIASDGGDLGAAVTVLDVTEYRQAQHMLQRIIDHAPNVIAFKDLDGRIRLVNTRGAHELLGREPEDVVGQSDEELFGSDLAERVRTQDHEVIAAAAPLTFEDDVVQSNGEVRSYLTTKFPIMGADGMPAASARFRRSDRDAARPGRPRAARDARPGRPGRDRHAGPRRPDRHLEPGCRADIRAHCGGGDRPAVRGDDHPARRARQPCRDGREDPRRAHAAAARRAHARRRLEVPGPGLRRRGWPTTAGRSRSFATSATSSPPRRRWPSTPRNSSARTPTSSGSRMPPAMTCRSRCAP